MDKELFSLHPVTQSPPFTGLDNDFEFWEHLPDEVLLGLGTEGGVRDGFCAAWTPMHPKLTRFPTKYEIISLDDSASRSARNPLSSLKTICRVGLALSKVAWEHRVRFCCPDTTLASMVQPNRSPRVANQISIRL